MDRMKVAELMKGVGVIIDDDIDKNDTLAYTFKESLIESGIPVVLFNKIPKESVIDSLGNVSFIVLDWEFAQSSDVTEGIVLGEELSKDKKFTILHFLKSLISKVFVPIFIITEQNFGDVTHQLTEAELYSNEKPNRIMLKQKVEVDSYSSLLSAVEEWLENTPSAHVLKLWETEAVNAKNQMFLDLFDASPYWVNVILKTLNDDAKGIPNTVNHEFGLVLNNNFVCRMNLCEFDSLIDKNKHDSDADEIRRVLQGERYISYNNGNTPTTPFLGDVFMKNVNESGDYLLNIRAQCNLMREPDPELYLIKGSGLDKTKIVRQSIRLRSNNILDINGQSFNLENLIDCDTKQKEAFNNKAYELKSLYAFSQGEILEKRKESIVTCICDLPVIRFDYCSFKVNTMQDLLNQGYERIGRLLPPYITRIQQGFSSYMIREGVMSTPEILFEL